ncbi:MarR family winged helix-turn-helix transcriptional regulator [Photobacterium minamisatsumaniensis]|uniref:MarR family winged helix-turn-helix transcriptional regulator n=1 Tax=Photobacterium minamisatsumaniensis TaxID=2910233 RepID=UPI003D1018C3
MTTKARYSQLSISKNLEDSPFFMMGVVHRYFRNQAQKELSAKYDITTEMQKALEVVNSFELISQQKLADALMNERSATKRLVDNLIKRDLLIAVKDENNQKHKLLKLSDLGAEVRASGNTIMKQLESDWLEKLSETEIEDLNKTLRKLTMNF